MKIICSKHQKDYYDHLVSYYGYDDHIVYDRRSNSLNKKRDWETHLLFSICGEYVPVLRKDDKFIFDPSGLKLDFYDASFLQKYKNKKSPLNEQYRQPVLICVGYPNKVAVPVLKEFGFAARIDAHEMYQKVYAFLSWLKDNPEIPNNQTDKEKIISHGHDPKTSFRPLMKENS
jgi:hypothetical protein